MTSRHAPDWRSSTLKKLGQLVSKDPFLLLERSFNSGFRAVTEEQGKCMGMESEGAFQAHEKHKRQGSGSVMLWMESWFLSHDREVQQRH